MAIPKTRGSYKYSTMAKKAMCAICSSPRSCLKWLVTPWATLMASALCPNQHQLQQCRENFKSCLMWCCVMEMKTPLRGVGMTGFALAFNPIHYTGCASEKGPSFQCTVFTNMSVRLLFSLLNLHQSSDVSTFSDVLLV